MTINLVSFSYVNLVGFVTTNWTAVKLKMDKLTNPMKIRFFAKEALNAKKITFNAK